MGLQIVGDFPTLVNPLKPTPDTDPFVVSLAIVQRKRLTLVLRASILPANQLLFMFL